MTLENKVIYQIYPKSFKDSNNDGIGDIIGIISKLDYLEQLGVDYLWLSPINASPQFDNGYDISSYMDIDPMFGTNEDYLALIKMANKHHIKIMMDLVLNHTSTAHKWFKAALAGDQEYMDYYVFKDEPTALKSIFGGSAWEYVPSLNKYYLHSFAKEQADLNWDNKHMRELLYNMINYWINKGVEGFRLDVIGMIGKDIDHNIMNFAPNFFKYIKELNNNTFKDKLLTVGECWGADIEIMEKMCNEFGLSEAFTFNHLCTTATSGDKFNQTPVDFKKILDIMEYWQNNYKGNEAIVMNNHDQPRLLSLWLNDSKYRIESAKLLITLFGFLKGNLYLYQGEEIGMSNAYMNDISDYKDIESINKYHELISNGKSNKEAMKAIMQVSRDNARVVMPWSNKVNGGFSEHEPWIKMHPSYDKINVENDLNSDTSIYKYYQEIIRFRKANPTVLNQPFEYTLDNDLLVFKKGNYTGICNLTAKEKAYQNGDEKEIIFRNYRDISNVLRAFEVVVYLIL